MKQILLPTDFSDYALNAIFTAIKLQGPRACNFILLHVYEPNAGLLSRSQDAVKTGMVYDALHKEALNKLDETLNTIAKVSDVENHTFSVQAIAGNLSETVSKLVTELDLDMIVMGTKGATGLKKIFLGSNTVRLLTKLRNCPILVVPRQFNFQALKTIVLPTQFAHFFSKGHLKTLLSLVENWQSNILVFNVAQEFTLSENQLANKKILEDRLASVHHTFDKTPIHTTVAEAITQFAEDQQADMICLVHYEHTFMEKLTQEPVVKKIGFQTSVPLLVLPE